MLPAGPLAPFADSPTKKPLSYARLACPPLLHPARLHLRSARAGAMLRAPGPSNTIALACPPPAKRVPMTFTFFFALAQDSRFFGRKEFKEFENVGKASEHCKAVPNRSSNGAYPNVLEPVTCTP